MEKLKKEKIKTSVMLAIIFALLALCAFMGVQALTNSKTTNFNLGTTFEPEVLVEVKMGIDSNSDNTIFDSEFVSIFNSADPNGVDYTAYYIESITDDTLNLKNETLVTTNGNVELKIINYDTEAKLRCYINNTTTITVEKATANISPEQNQTIAVGTPTLGAVLISLRFESVTSATVTYNTNGGTTISESVIEPGTLLTLPTAPTKTNYIFGGWYIDAGLTQKFDETSIIDGDLTLYAKWAVVWDETTDTTWYTNGSSPYKISNGKQLAGLASLVNSGTTFTGKTIELTENIFLNAGKISSTGSSTGTTHTWTPIGNSSTNAFAGTFDGKGFEVSGSYVSSSSKSFLGLFSYSKGTIKNLGIINCYHAGEFETGGICGYNLANGVIEKCYNAGIVAVTGYGTEYSVKNSSKLTNTDLYAGSARLKSCAGGVVGGNAGLVNKCYNKGYVCGPSAGGIVGRSYGNDSLISNSYNVGVVSGNGVGGIMGFNGHTADGGDGVGDITMCYNMSQLLGSSGGICGYFANLTGLGKAISNSFNAGSTTYAIYSDSEYNPIVTNCYYSLGQNLGSYATATNEENFKSATWLANTLHWDMENVWQISPYINNGYPTLR